MAVSHCATRGGQRVVAYKRDDIYSARSAVWNSPSICRLVRVRQFEIPLIKVQSRADSHGMAHFGLYTLHD